MLTAKQLAHFVFDNSDDFSDRINVIAARVHRQERNSITAASTRELQVAYVDWKRQRGQSPVGDIWWATV